MRRSFTLIELLITAAIMALVSLAILSVFAGGINVYGRLRSYSNVRKDILLSLERVEKDLRSACNISEIKFNGESSRITFPALVNANPSSGIREPSPGSISYYVDAYEHYLVSEAMDYSAATAKEPGKGAVTQLVSADKVKFSYYYYDPESEAYMWGDKWTNISPEEKTGVAASSKIKANTPLGVKIEMQYADRGKSFTLYRTVFFPLAVSLRLAAVESEKAEKASRAVNGEKKG